MRQRAWLLGVAAVLACACVWGEDWPQWRGPRGDGISREPLPAEWPKDGPKKIWSVTVGAGFSSPIAVKGVVYQFAADGGQEVLRALDAATGKELWKQGYAPVGLKEGGYQGTRTTPTYEDGKLYTMGGGGQVVCWNAADGKILWECNVLQDVGAQNLDWGMASNPLIVGDRIYVQAGKGGPVLVGINKTTGKIEWKSQETGMGGYAHPILVDVDGTKQLVVLAGQEVLGIAPETGKTIWKIPWKTPNDVNATTPLYRDGNLMISSGYSHGSMMLKLSPTGAEKVWENKELSSRFPGMILSGDYVYGNNEGTLRCLHWPDGKLVWSDKIKINVGGSLVLAGDKLLVISERGKMFLLKTDGLTHTLLGETDAPIFDTDQAWATPLLYEGKIYAKGGAELDCLDLSGK